MENLETLLKMGMGEGLRWPNAWHVTRVPGGWIFTNMDSESNPGGVFVPYSEK